MIPFSHICWSAVMVHFSSTEIHVLDAFCESRSVMLTSTDDFEHPRKLHYNFSQRDLNLWKNQTFDLSLWLWLEGMRWKSFMRTALNMWVILPSTQLMSVFFIVKFSMLGLDQSFWVVEPYRSVHIKVHLTDEKTKL